MSRWGEGGEGGGLGVKSIFSLGEGVIGPIPIVLKKQLGVKM